MGKINFTKMVGAGNDFVVLDFRDKGQGTRDKGLSLLAKKICERKIEIGADGVLVLEKSKIADFRMRIFNSDGSVAEMCGNGLRCAVLFTGIKRKIKIETKAGIYEGEITSKDRVKIKIEAPSNLKMNLPVNLNGRTIKVNFINTGVPHAVIFVEGIDNIDVNKIGPEIRYHEEFKPKGTNVDFVEVIDENNIKIRTYERGVEEETLACGTGAVASAIIKVLSVKCKVLSGTRNINVHTKGGVLKVSFSKAGDRVKDIYLEGEAKIVFEGQIRT